MINIESRKEIKDCLVFTTDDILLSESTRGKIFLSNESLFFRVQELEEIFSAMESLPAYVPCEIWYPQLIGLMKEKDGGIIIVRGERTRSGSGSITNCEGTINTGLDFNIEVFSEIDADPNRGWFAKGSFLVTPDSFNFSV